MSATMYSLVLSVSEWGTGIRRLPTGLATLLPRISGQRQCWKTPGELGVSNPWNLILFPLALQYPDSIGLTTADIVKLRAWFGVRVNVC